jgi:hypothetical protein
MSFIAAGTIAVATIGSSLISSSAASKASNVQAESTERAAQLQNEQFLKGIELQEPFRQGGLQGQNKLLTYLGLGGTPQYDDTAYNKALADYNASLSRLDPSQFTTGGGGGGYYTSGGGESDQIPVYQEGTGGTFDQAGYDKARAGIVAPDREQFRLTSGDVNDPNFGKYATAEYTPEMFAKGIDPGYQFRLKEGMQGLERSAAARGGLLSGGTLKGIQRYGQDMASQEYQNAFNRYQAERTGTLNPLQSLAGVGQSTANTLGTMGMNYANQVGELYQGGANARASGYVGSANAINQGISGVSNQYYQNQLMNRVFPQGNQQLINQYGSGNVYTPGGGGSVGFYNPVQDPYQ